MKTLTDLDWVLEEEQAEHTEANDVVYCEVLRTWARKEVREWIQELKDLHIKLRFETREKPLGEYSKTTDYIITSSQGRNTPENYIYHLIGRIDAFMQKFELTENEVQD